MENLAQYIVQTIRESLLILDGELRIQIANDAFCRTFQSPRCDVENHLLFELGAGNWNIPALQTTLLGILAGDVAVENFVFQQEFSGIGNRTMSLNARLIQRNTGDAPLLLLAIEDISERERAEEIRRLHLEKLEQSNRELQDFVYIASHDLQEPLRAIQSFSERLRSKNAAVLDAQGVDYLDRIEKAATRMRQLISDLLLYSRVTTKTSPMSTVNLAQVAQTVLADLAVRLKESGGEVKIGALPVVTADATQMRQLLQNLIGNSLKFRQPDEAPQVKISSSGIENGFHRLRIEDNGIGFEEKYAERIFAPFERLHSSREYAGTGIGLAICRKIVERHRGHIEAQSAPGKGSVFQIGLPVEQEEESHE